MEETSPLVLIIDDEPEIRSSIRYLLEDYDYRVAEAGDGAEGIDLFLQDVPALVLCDLRMPGLDGLEVLSALQRLSPETPVIVITGTTVAEETEEALRQGAYSCLNKPIINFDNLVRQIDIALNVRR